MLFQSAIVRVWTGWGFVGFAKLMSIKVGEFGGWCDGADIYILPETTRNVCIRVNLS